MFFLDALCVQWATRQAVVRQDIRDNFRWKNITKLLPSTETVNGSKTVPLQGLQHVARQYCLEIKWRTCDLTFCEWQTHYWHVQGHCSQAGDNGAVPVYWPSRQRAARWWTTPSVFWQRVDNCLHCGGMCIFPIYGPVRHNRWLDTYQKKHRVVHVVNLHMWLNLRHLQQTIYLTAQQNYIYFIVKLLGGKKGQRNKIPFNN